MVSIRFTSFLLGLLLLLIAVRDSTADSHQALKKMPVAEVNPPPATGMSMTLNKEIFGNGVLAAEVKNTRPGGRKMMLTRALGKEMVEGEGGYGEASQISGAAHFVGNCNHKRRGMLNVEGKGIYSSKKLLGTSEDNMIYQVKEINPQESNNPFDQPVSQKLHGPATEIVKLVHQDYQGASGPQHKPPINNADPLSQEHLMP
ncbi:hypothetical protein AAG906_001519 [Vitis piasezkii]